jgi:hypothetical protein
VKKEIRHIIPLLFSFLAISSSYCQVTADIQDYLRERFQNYVARVPWEEIYIHTDREEYISGESIWFKVYLIDRQRFKPSSHSRIAYFEVLNDANRPVIQKRILITGGFGPGQVLLPDTLSTGIYTIRAYTNWMKNFLPDNCFEKDIKIYNAISDRKLVIRSDPRGELRKSIINRSDPGDARTELRMEIINRNPDVMEIAIHPDKRFRRENGNLFFLCIQTHGILDHISSEIMDSGITKIHILRKSLTRGINQVTLFNSKAQPVIERYSYTPAAEEYESVKLQSEGKYGPREKVDLGISVSGKDADLAGMSLSVTPAAVNNYFSLDDYLVFGSEFGPIERNILESGSATETPDVLIDSLLQGVKSRWIDWEKILSSAPLHFKYTAEEENHFLPGKLVAGDKAVPPSSALVLMSMPGKEATFQYARTDADGNFSFEIHIDENARDLVFQQDDPENGYIIMTGSSFSDTYRQHGEPADPAVTSPHPYIRDMGVNYQVSRIYGVSDIGNILVPAVMPEKALRFYGKPDIELIMADYVTLPEMKEVFLELLPHVSLQKKRTGYRIQVADRINNSRYEYSPALFLDGIKIRDASVIAGLDPSLVEKIDIIKEEYRVGRYSFPGILNVITRSGDFSAIPLPGYMMRIPYRVVEPVQSFVSPDYSSPSKRNSTIPDFRNTLYWNPVVRPGKDGKADIGFWTSDIVSDYVIKLEGFTSDGKIVSVRKSFRVE